MNDISPKNVRFPTRPCCFFYASPTTNKTRHTLPLLSKSAISFRQAYSFPPCGDTLIVSHRVLKVKHLFVFKKGIFCIFPHSIFGAFNCFALYDFFAAYFVHNSISYPHLHSNFNTSFFMNVYNLSTISRYFILFLPFLE